MSKVDKKLMFEAAEAIYSTAFDGNGWQQFLDVLVNANPELRTVLQYRDSGFQVRPRNLIRGYGAEFVDSYLRYYNDHDRSTPIMRTSGIGEVFTNVDPARVGGFFGQEFYHEWIRPQDDIGRALGVVLSRDETGLWFLAGHLPFGQEDGLAEATFATIKALAPLMVRAARLSTQMAAEATSFAPAAALLDQLVSAVFCVDRKGRLVYANAAGERLIRQGDVVRTAVDGRLRFHDAAADATFAKACVGGGREAVGDATQFFAAPSPLRDRVLSVTVTPYRPRARSGLAARTDEGTTLVMVTDPNAMPVPPTALLRRTYGLTPAEAAVAEQLAAGLTPQDIADVGGTKTSTVRSQMKALMIKMGAKRQADVVRIVLGLAGGFKLGQSRQTP